MSPIDSGVTYTGINNFSLMYSTNSTGLWFWAPMHLPAGALITYLELDGYDNTNAGMIQAALFVCDFTGETCNSQSVGACSDAAGMTACSGITNTQGYSSWSADLTSLGITVDNFEGRYRVAVGNTTTDGNTAISQIIIGYTLQVSPAPSTATFADVQPGDFGFQFIEALAASGITGGCGGGNYCPNNNVTRAQMAVFLAKALGLQWQ